MFHSTTAKLYTSIVAIVLVLGSFCNANSEDRVVYEATVDAGIDAVWDAFTTTEGIQKWIAPVADIELAVGGKMRATYDPDGKLGDKTTIENTILAYDPKRMLAMKATKFPTGFPFEGAAKKTWSVFYFEEIDATHTKVTLAGLGYTDDEQSQQMKSFFETANKYSFDKLNRSLQPK